ncbi:MAG: hypothetical protein R2771_10330 [Saprospiraceae bacterium]
MKKTIIFYLMAFLGFTSMIYGQKMDKGYMKFEITDFTTDENADPQMAMASEMIKGTITKVYFDGMYLYQK